MSTSITVRDVPDQTRDELASRAALTGRSLQEYLRAKLVELARQPDAEVLIARVRAARRRVPPRCRVTASSPTGTRTAGDAGRRRFHGRGRADGQRCGRALGRVIAGRRFAGGSAPDARRGRQYLAEGGAGRRISADVASLAHTDLLDLRVEFFPYQPYAARVWELRENVTCYDGWYVAVAELLDAPLATLDGRLANSPGPRCQFLLPPAET